jgi:hypothetical protein
VCIAPDGFVFVADSSNHRVQVLTPALDFHGFIGVGQLEYPAGVCASADVVVVAELVRCRVSVFGRGDGALLRCFGCRGGGDGQLSRPAGLCFLSDDRLIAVADEGNRRVCVFSVDGEFIRHVGVGVLKSPIGVACSPFDELVVADFMGRCVILFTPSGTVSGRVGSVNFTGVVLRRGSVFAQEVGGTCVVFA